MKRILVTAKILHAAPSEAVRFTLSIKPDYRSGDFGGAFKTYLNNRLLPEHKLQFRMDKGHSRAGPGWSGRATSAIASQASP